MKALTTWMLALAMLAAGAAALAADPPRGRMTGGVKYAMPDWFKASFLDIPEDLAEAGKRNRHLLLFLHLDECPYCERLLAENFHEGSNRTFLTERFDAIAINVRGANEVTWIDGKRTNERELARALKTVATPTLLFLEPGGGVVLRLNGYRHPAPFRQALEYVAGRYYRSASLVEYASRHPLKKAYRFRAHPMFTGSTDLSSIRGPLAIVFEAANCADCAEWHDRVFNHPMVLAELKAFRVVRLDADATAPVRDPAGRLIAPRDWVRELGLDYRPGILLYNEGAERARVDGMLYKFHLRERLRYVGGRHYAGGTSYRTYSAARRDELLKRGETIDYAR